MLRPNSDSYPDMSRQDIETIFRDLNPGKVSEDSVYYKFSCVLPGHRDENPSASMRKDNGIYKCFRCFSGDESWPITKVYKEVKGEYPYQRLNLECAFKTGQGNVKKPQQHPAWHPLPAF